MAKKDELLALIARYETDLAEARNKVGYFERFFKSDADLPTGYRTQRFFEQADELLGDTPAEESADIFEVILQTGIDHLEQRYLGLTYSALQRNLLPLLPNLTAEQAAAFAEKIKTGIPRRYRTPLTDKLLAGLKQAAKN